MRTRGLSALVSSLAFFCVLRRAYAFDDRVACERGESQACVRAGRTEEEGLGRPPDDEAALALYDRACNLGAAEGCRQRDDLRALLSTSTASDSGHPAPVSRYDAAARIAVACKDGRPQACAVLASRSEDLGLPRRASRLYLKACVAGEELGCDGLRGMFVKGTLAEPVRAESLARMGETCALTPPAAACAEDYMAKARAAESRSPVRFAFYLAMACEAGAARACLALGQKLGGGDWHVPRERRSSLLLRACDLGLPRGCVEAAQARASAGTNEDAMPLFLRACEARELEGCRGAASLYRGAYGHARDAARAEQLLQKACDGIDLESCDELSVMLERGDGVPRDTARADRLRERACSHATHYVCARDRPRSPMPSSTFVAVGGVLALSPGNAASGGLELSITHYPWWSPRPETGSGAPIGLGLFTQALVDQGDHLHFVAGPQLNVLPLGVELGYAFLSENETHLGTHALHVAPFCSFGLLSFAVRWTVPLSGGAAYPGDVRFTVALKLPFSVDGKSSVENFVPVLAAR